MRSQDVPPSRPLKVLILTSAVGGGHEASGRATQAELEAAGHQVILVDGVRPLSRRLEWLLREGYHSQLDHAAWTYDLGFRMVTFWPVAPALRYLSGVILGRRLWAVIEPVRPDLVVSTYPLTTMVLGYLRRRRRLTAPVAALVTDYGTHEMWGATGVDLHLVACRHSAARLHAARRTVRVARLPLSPAFASVPGKAEARAALDLPEDAFVALVVGGAWGVGDVEGAAAAVLAAGAHAIVVTGTNAALRAQLAARYGGCRRARILGWTDEMPRLMAAADCLIQNAGGVTCLEAVEVGLPILIYRPLAGHGRLNARAMEEAGIGRGVTGPAELQAVVSAAAAGTLCLPRPVREPAPPAIEAMLDLTRAQPERGRRRRLRRPLLVAAPLVALLWWLGYLQRAGGLAQRAYRSMGESIPRPDWTARRPRRHHRVTAPRRPRLRRPRLRRRRRESLRV